MGLSVSEPGHQHDGPGVWNEIKARARFISFQDSDSRDTCNFPLLHPLSPFQYLGAFTSRPSIDFIFFTRTMSFRFFPSSFPVFFSSSSRHFRLVNLRKKFLLDRRKKRSRKRSRHILPSFLSSCLRIVSRSIHLLPSFFFLLPPFSRIGNSILEKAKNVVDKRPWRNAVRTFLCTIEYDCEIIDNLEWLHRRSWLHFIQRFDLYQEFCLRCLLTPNIYKYRSMFSFLPSFFFF